MRGLDILKIQLFVLHNTDTISSPLSDLRFLLYDKQHCQSRCRKTRSIFSRSAKSSFTKAIPLSVYPGWPVRESGCWVLGFQSHNQVKIQKKKTPPNVGLEPTTTRLRVLRSADWANRAWVIWMRGSVVRINKTPFSSFSLYIFIFSQDCFFLRKKIFRHKRSCRREVWRNLLPAGFQQARRKSSGDSGDRTRDLSHPKRESYR